MVHILLVFRRHLFQKFYHKEGLLTAKAEWKLPVPREHGAWAMLYTPFMITTLIVRAFDWKLFYLFIAVSALFFAHEASAIAVRLKRTSNQNQEQGRHAIRWLVMFLLITLIASTPLILVYQRWILIPLGIMAAALLASHTLLIAQRVERTVFGELLGIISLTLSSPVAYYVARGRFDRTALVLWVLNLLYFISSLFYIKMLIGRFSRKCDRSRLIRQCILYHVLLVGIASSFAYGWSSALILVAFFPALARTIWGLTARGFHLNLRRIGFIEAGLTLLFATMVVISLYG